MIPTENVVHSSTTIEQLVTSSCLFTGQNSIEVANAMQYFVKRFNCNDLVNKLCHDTLLPKIDSWIEFSKGKASA